MVTATTRKDIARNSRECDSLYEWIKGSVTTTRKLLPLSSPLATFSTPVFYNAFQHTARLILSYSLTPSLRSSRLLSFWTACSKTAEFRIFWSSFERQSSTRMWPRLKKPQTAISRSQAQRMSLWSSRIFDLLKLHGLETLRLSNGIVHIGNFELKFVPSYVLAKTI